MSFKYAVFDFDGTLADTEKINLNIFQQLSEKYNFKKIALEELSHLKKMSAKEVIDYLGIKKRKIPFAIKKGKKILGEDIHKVKPCKENIKEVLLALKKQGVVLGILTTNSQVNVEKFLDSNDLNIFDFIMSSSLFGKELKLKKIMKKYKIENNELLYIGDEIRDIVAAHLVHIKIASVTWGYNNMEGLKKYNPDFLINNPDELVSICCSD